MLRKTRFTTFSVPYPMFASMRPQRNAAENLAGPAAQALEGFASMRPQRNAAENVHPGGASTRTRQASMRPQRNAAEN